MECVKVGLVVSCFFDVCLIVSFVFTLGVFGRNCVIGYVFTNSVGDLYLFWFFVLN